MQRFIDRQTISQMFEPAISGLTQDALIRAENASVTMNRVVRPSQLTDPEDEYSKIFLEKLSQEPMKTDNLKHVGLVNGIRRVMIAIYNKVEISPELVLSIHNEVSEDLSFNNRNAWRTKYVEDDDEEAIYAIPEDIYMLMNHACFCYSTSSARPLIKAAAFEAAIECIHPFNDANGRTARLCLALTLATERFPPIAFPTKEALIQYHESTKMWVREKNANPLLNLIAANVEEEAKNRTFYAIF